jgi:hypothetical protein
MKTIKWIGRYVCLLHYVFGLTTLCTVKSLAQAPGSESVYGGLMTLNVQAGGTHADVSETIYIGPGTYQINGTWEIYSKNVIIDPAAVISGIGMIRFYNPSAAGGTSSPTYVDGNGSMNAIDVNIGHHNGLGMVLAELSVPQDIINWLGFTPVTDNSSIYIGRDLQLAVDNANITLGSNVEGNLIFDSDATLSGFRPERMVITNNNILSHMVKQDASAGFVFPIGIVAGSYTPAKVTGSGTYHASVQDYGASSSNEGLLHGGIDRSWHLYADEPANAAVAFQHYTANDTSPFSSSSPHFVTQYQGAAWSGGTETAGLAASLTTNTAASPVPGSSLQDLSDVSIPGSNAASSSYFTKTNQRSLPVILAVFKIVKEATTALLTWNTTEETNTDRFEVEHSTDAKSWQLLGQQLAVNRGKETNAYSFVDASPVAGINYYRLKMVDRDGTYSYSRVQSVSFNLSGLQLVVYPNPVSERLYFKDANGKGVATEQIEQLSVIDRYGRLIMHTYGPTISDGLNVEQWPAGTYLVTVTLANGTLSTHKVVVKM